MLITQTTPLTIPKFKYKSLEITTMDQNDMLQQIRIAVAAKIRGKYYSEKNFKVVEISVTGMGLKISSVYNNIIKKTLANIIGENANIEIDLVISTNKQKLYRVSTFVEIARKRKINQLKNFVGLRFCTINLKHEQISTK